MIEKLEKENVWLFSGVWQNALLVDLANVLDDKFSLHGLPEFQMTKISFRTIELLFNYLK